MVQPDPTAPLKRPARALIGWMRPEEAALSMLGRRRDLALTAEQTAQLERARAAVAARGIVEKGDIVAEVPAALAEHIESLRQNTASAGYFNEGWRIGIADLTKVRAVQPHVFTDEAVERIEGIDLNEVMSIASISLPVAKPPALQAQFDEVRQAWVFSSRNPNLRIMGHFGGEVQPGMNGFGFVVTIATSFMQVAIYRDSYLLRDGYHRAYGLLSQGVTRVTVFVKEFERFNDLALPPGMLDQDAFLGDRPPLLPDYLNDAVSVPVELPATQKTVVVQGLELTTLG